mgnify:CR=1 FL=1
MNQETQYEVVIGLEVHLQLSTNTKIFCGCANEFGQPPNTRTCPVCLGLPGSLPVVNARALEFAVKVGLALNCTVNPFVKFDRKNYFYPDCPKAYQISQFDHPIAEHGYLNISLEDEIKKIGITRIHMEEDAGKLIHDNDPNYTSVDLNRAGTPLIEIVSEPDIRTPKEAATYMRALRDILQYLDICDGNLEQGSLRCDANVSVRPRGREKFGTRTELKNMNSFRNVEKAIEFEIYRQIELIEEGGEVVQQTRLWDTTKNQTRVMRSKEEAHDYRYFPEPDLPPVIVTAELLADIKEELPELADVRQKRFMEEYAMSENDAVTLTESRYLADYFEEVVSFTNSPKSASNMVLSEVLRVLNEQSIDIREFSVTPERLSVLIKLKEEDKINSSAMQEVFNAMLGSEKSAEELAKEMNLIQVSDSGFLEPIVDEIVAENPDEVKRYKEGKKQLMGFFVGQVMKASKGKANPKLVTEMVSKKLQS